MTKWIEQPAFEKNEFKVGDHVNIYTWPTTYRDCVITLIENDTIIVDRDDRYSKGNKLNADFHQCRLLKKREAREIWLDLGTGKFCKVYEGAIVDKAAIKVREVLEDDNE